jgi:hypothetical protein
MNKLKQQRETIEFVEYGNKDGKVVIYFHGAPGTIEECVLFDV